MTPPPSPVSEEAKGMLQQEDTGVALGGPAGCWEPWPRMDSLCDSGPSLFLPEPLFPWL